MTYLDYITSHHNLYDRYYEDWRHCLNAWYGGVEYKSARYLRAYQVDMNQPSESINTYVTNSDGSVVSKVKAKLTQGVTADSTNRGQDIIEGSFYGEKLDNTPLYNYVKLIVAEYSSILFRNAPQRILPQTPETDAFRSDVSGEGESLNEFMSLVDMFVTIFGVCHVGCYMPAAADYPKWRIHTPLDVTNWNYVYDADGNLKMDSIVIKLSESEDHVVYRHITPATMETIFVGTEDDFEPPVDDPRIEEIGAGSYRIVQENELGYIPVVTIYQNTKVYNNVGTTIIQDVAQIQRSIYGDMAEIYNAITYGAHPTLVVDTETDQLNDGQIGAEPGSVVRVQGSLTGEANYVYEFVSPSLDAITEIRELVDSKIQKLTQIAMLRSEDLIRSSRSGEQIEVYDDKLAGLIRRKATNLENSEARLWKIWADWMNVQLPEDFGISYNRQYNKRALEQEIAEIQHIMTALEKYEQIFGEDYSEDLEEDIAEMAETDSYETPAQAEARAAQFGGSGFHSHTTEQGVTIYMPFETHELYLTALREYYAAEISEDSDSEDAEFSKEMRDKIRRRLRELLDSTSTSNSL